MTHAINPNDSIKPRTEMPPPAGSSEMWTRLILFVLACAAGGAAYYYFIWRFRLPQDLTLTDRQGQAIAAHLESRNDVFVKFTAPGDDTARFIALQSLSDSDQAFMQKFPSGLDTLVLPLNCALVDQAGKAWPMQLVTHDTAFVKYIAPADNLVHYLPIANLSVDDQAFVRQLPAGSIFSYPMDYTLTDEKGNPQAVKINGRSEKFISFTPVSSQMVHLRSLETLAAADRDFLVQAPTTMTSAFPLKYSLVDGSGQATSVRLEGRTESLLKYLSQDDHHMYLIPIGSLQPEDQALIRQLPLDLTSPFPAIATFTDSEGKTTTARLDGHSDDLLSYTLPGEAERRNIPISQLSDAWQDMIKELPVNMGTSAGSYPVEMSLADAQGHALSAKLVGRTDLIGKFALDEDGSTRYVPLGNLPKDDQNVAQRLPVNERIHYPVECMLMDQSGHLLQVVLNGRSSLSVQFSLAGESALHAYPIARLATPDQAFVNLLPVSMSDEDLAGAVVVPTAVESASVSNMRDRIAKLKQDDVDMNVRIADPDTSYNDRQFMQDKVKTNEGEIAALKQALGEAGSSSDGSQVSH